MEILFLWLIAQFSSALSISCKYSLDFSAPGNLKFDSKVADLTCSGEYCMYMNTTGARDSATKKWSGEGWGCQSAAHPQCASLGLGGGGCRSLRWESVSLFGLASVQVFQDGVLCCCNGADACDPTAPKAATAAATEPCTEAPPGESAGLQAQVNDSISMYRGNYSHWLIVFGIFISFTASMAAFLPSSCISFFIPCEM